MVTSSPDTGPANRWKVLAVIAATLQLVVIDMTVLHVASPALSADLRPTAIELLWIVDVYSLMVAPLLVLAATLADRFGRRRMLVGGLVFFTVASVLAALAWSPGALIAARALQGIGGAALLPATMAIIRDVFPDRDERVKAIGIWSASMAGGAAAGPIIGGLLIEWFSWRAVFLVNVPVLAVVLPFALRWIPESRSTDPPPWDPASVAMVTSGVLLFAYGIKEAARHGLGDPVTVGAVVIGVGLLAMFTRRQLTRDHPTLDLRLFASTPFRVAVGCILLTVFAIVGLELFFAQYMQLVLGLGPAESSLRLAPLLIATLAGGLVAAKLLIRFGTRTVMSVGLIAGGLSLLPILVTGLDDEYLLFIPGFVILGLGLEVALVAANDVMLASVSKDGAAQASAIEETAYEFGGGLGVAVLGSILAGIYTRGITVPPEAAAGGEQAKESLSEAALAAERIGGPAGDALLTAARQAFVDGLHASVVVATVLTVAAGLLALAVLRGGRLGAELEGHEPGG